MVRQSTHKVDLPGPVPSGAAKSRVGGVKRGPGPAGLGAQVGLPQRPHYYSTPKEKDGLGQLLLFLSRIINFPIVDNIACIILPRDAPF